MDSSQTNETAPAIGEHGLVRLRSRGVLRLGGPDRQEFLQGLVSNDVRSVSPTRAVHAFLLTPQGKFLHDMFLLWQEDALLVDCEFDRRDDLLRRLKTYRLRSKVEIDDVSSDHLVFAAAAGSRIDGGLGFADPRHPALGDRVLLPPDHVSSAAEADQAEAAARDRHRIALAVPDGSRDMEVGKAILLENNADLLNGVAWDKGCYIGQELTARTRYRGLVKKRLTPVRLQGDVPPPGTVLVESGTEIGEMRSSNGDLGLALLRLDFLRQSRAAECDGCPLLPDPPPHLASAIAAAAAAAD